jgi:hypothetical protein
LARLAVAHAADLEFEQAGIVGQQAIRVVQEARSARALRELSRLDTLLRGWNGASEAAKLRRALEALMSPVTLATGTLGYQTAGEG